MTITTSIPATSAARLQPEVLGASHMLGMDVGVGGTGVGVGVGVTVVEVGLVIRLEADRVTASGGNSGPIGLRSHLSGGNLVVVGPVSELAEVIKAPGP